MPKLTIGRVATEGGVNVETIRYYQRRELLEEPAKPVGGYRNYPKEIVKQIRFIKRAQALRFSLKEVAELLQLDVADACAKSCDLADQKLAVIDQKIAELATRRRALAQLMALCDNTSTSWRQSKQIGQGSCLGMRQHLQPTSGRTSVGEPRRSFFHSPVVGSLRKTPSCGSAV